MKIDVAEITKLNTELTNARLSDVFVEVESNRIVFKDQNISVTLNLWDETQDPPIKNPTEFQKIDIETNRQDDDGRVYSTWENRKKTTL